MESHCCETMRREVERVCDQHPDRNDCPDCLVHYSPRLREYGILIHDGGSSVFGIRFCPWCGARLPESLRGEWFDELRRRGIDPWDADVPDEFRSSAWWRAQVADPEAKPDRDRADAATDPASRVLRPDD